MKTITNHLSQIILAVSAIALIVGVLLAFSGPVGTFFEGITDKLDETGNGSIWDLGEYGSSDGSGDGSDEVTLTLEGGGQTFHKFAPSALTFRSTADLSDFQEVQINGVTVDPAYYTLTEGSTIVTLSIDYLQTLDADAHEITVVSTNGAPSAGFEVIEPELNEYNFYYNQPYTAYVSALGAKVAFFVREDGTFDSILIGGGTETGTYEISGNSIVSNSSMGELHSTLSADGTEIYCTELATSFVLSDESVVADEDFIYIYKEELGGYEVTAIDKTKSSYAPIRTGVNGYDTVALANWAFEKASNMTIAPEIPNTVTSIGSHAFSGCTSLESVEIPESVTSINACAFFGCTSLESIEIPASVTSIGYGAFSDCTSLTSIELPDSVSSIDSILFADCSSLTGVTIPASVTAIKNQAFQNCTSLESITFEGTVAVWNAISKNTSVNNWDKNTGDYTIYCTDGTIAKDGTVTMN